MKKNDELHDELYGIPQRSVMDPVHGGIPFFGHEQSAIEHPLFQRLRFIDQNDVTSLVFPGATHTRFLHSLGAMHIAGKFLKAVFRSYLADPQNVRDHRISEDEEKAIRYAYFCIRLAALLHDTGHFPFSHQFEHAHTIRSLLERRETFLELWKGETWQAYYKSPPNKLKHEHYSIRVAHEVLKKVAVVDPIDVLGIMETTDCNPTEVFNKGAKQILRLLLRDRSTFASVEERDVGLGFREFLKSILSGELDIDKMDYLLRDSFFSGVKYGTYNLDHLLNNLRIGFSMKPYWVGIAITEKGVGAFEDFVHSRFQLYQYVYSHKAVVGFKWLLMHAMEEVMVDNKTRAAVSASLTSIAEFQRFSDTYFWEKFRLYAALNPSSACARLLSRTPLEYLQTSHDLPEFRIEDTIDELTAELKSRGENAEVTHFASPIKFSRVGDAKFEKIRVLVKAPVTLKRSLREIKEKSHFFEKFNDLEIVHFYVKPSLSQSLPATV